MIQAAAGGEGEVRRDAVVADVEDLRDLLARLQGEEVGDVLALRVAAGLLHLVRLGAVDPSGGGEEQQPVVGRGDEEVLDHVIRPQLRALDAAAAAVLTAVVVAAGALDVPAAGDGDDHLLLGDQVFDAHVAVEAEHDLGAPVVAVLRDDLGELLGRRSRAAATGLARIALYPAISVSSSASAVLIFCRSSAASRRSCRARIASACSSSIFEQLDEPLARVVDIRRAADERDDLIERVEGLEVAALDVRVRLGLLRGGTGCGAR